MLYIEPEMLLEAAQKKDIVFKWRKKGDVNALKPT